jgi:ABC-type transport system substrate-binding protein
MAEATIEAPGVPKRKTPVGSIHVVDPHPLNWLHITWNTMEEPVRTDAQGHLIGAAMGESRWVDDRTLQVHMRRDIRFQDGEECTARSFQHAFEEVQKWRAPPPVGCRKSLRGSRRLPRVFVQQAA